MRYATTAIYVDDVPRMVEGVTDKMMSSQVRTFGGQIRDFLTHIVWGGSVRSLCVWGRRFNVTDSTEQKATMARGWLSGRGTGPCYDSREFSNVRASC